VRLPNNKSVSDAAEIRHFGALDRHLRIDSQENGVVCAYTFTDHGNVLLGTDRGNLFLYSKNGHLLDRFGFERWSVGHFAVQRDTIAVSFENGTIVILKNVEDPLVDSEFISLVK
jgi:hypothetical protein